MSKDKTIVAIFGGAFDPIHNHHLQMAYECLNFGYCEEVWFTPSPDRWDKKLIASVDRRLDMISHAIAGEKRFKLCLDEVEESEYRGSYVFLNLLSERYLDYEFRLLVGSDSYPNIKYWRDPKNFYGDGSYNGYLLKRDYALIILPRQDFQKDMESVAEDQKKNPLEIKGIYDFRESNLKAVIGNISSTEVRKRIKLRKASGLIPAPVLKYIDDKKLYLED